MVPYYYILTTMDTYNRWNTSNSAAGGSSLHQSVSYNAAAPTTWTIDDITQKMITFEIGCLNASLREADIMNASKNSHRNVKKRNLRDAIKAWCDCSQSLKKKASNTVQLYVHALHLTDEANIEFAIAKYC